VLSCEEITEKKFLEWGPPDEEKLKNFLIEKMQFNPTRIDNAIEKWVLRTESFVCWSWLGLSLFLRAEYDLAPVDFACFCYLSQIGSHWFLALSKRRTRNA
jgi:hypothetical protein